MPLTGALCLALACTPARGPAPNDVPAAERMLHDAVSAVASRQPALAEEMLVTIAREHPDTPAAVEVPYWRAVLRLDPTSPHMSPRDAVWLLDLYLSSERPVEHRPHALALRRTAAAVDSLQRRVQPPERPPAVEGTLERALERQRELERENAQLRESLEKTSAELERIRRRLAAPPPQ